MYSFKHMWWLRKASVLRGHLSRALKEVRDLVASWGRSLLAGGGGTMSTNVLSEKHAGHADTCKEVSEAARANGSTMPDEVGEVI